jgi:hypothetical protein
MDIIAIVYSYKNDLDNMKLESRNMNRLNDLKNIINILGNTLSYAENYAMMNGYQSQKKEFSEYDYYNASEKTQQKLYREKFIASISNLDNVYGYYINKYRELPLPPSLPKKKIIDRLNSYKQAVNANDREIYNNLIKVFYGSY